MLSSRLSLHLHGAVKSPVAAPLWRQSAAIHNSASCSYQPGDSNASGNAGRPLFKSFAARLGNMTNNSGRQSPLPSMFPGGAPKTRPPILSGKALLQQRIQERIKERIEKVRKEESGGQERAARDEEIQSAIVTVISEEGVVLGAQPLAKVLHEMDRSLYTLVLVDPQQDPPACRMFSRKLIYEKERLARKQRAAAPKKPRPQTVVMSESIGRHDLLIKIGRARDMLAKGKRVTMVVESKGKHRSSVKRAEVGEEIVKQLTQHASVCAPPVLEPNTWSVTLQGKVVASTIL